MRSCLLLLAAAALPFGCGESKKEKGSSAAAPVDGKSTEVDGAGSAQFPSDAIPEGGTLALEVIDVPTEFASASAELVPASKAVRLTATDADGAALAKTAVAGSLQLDITSGAALAVDATDENLCALGLKSDGGKLVYRRSTLTDVDLAKGTATLKTIWFGAFQLAYCGTTSLAGFTDVVVGEDGKISAPKPAQ